MLITRHLLPLFYLLSMTAHAADSCSSSVMEACRIAEIIATEYNSSNVPGRPFSQFIDGQRLESVQADGVVLQTTFQVNRLHQEMTHRLKMKNVPIAKMVEVAKRSIKLGICYRLPPRSLRKKLLSSGGSVRHVVKSLDDLVLYKITLKNCAEDPIIEMASDNFTSQYSEKHKGAHHWEMRRNLFIYSRWGSKCTFWENGTPYNAWGRSEQVWEAWTKPDSGQWAARTGFYKYQEPLTYYHFEGIDACKSFVRSLGDQP